MNRFSAALLALLVSAGGLAAADPAAPDARGLLAASDAVRFPRESFRMTIDLFEYRDSKLADTLLLTVFSRAEPEGGQAGNLVRYEIPAKDAGKLMLFNKHDLWFYDPRSHANVRLSPQQRLIGQAANGDVMTTSFALDYTPTLAGEETVLDGDRAQRQTIRLDLQAATPDATYHRIEYWIERGSARPVKARFISDSGQLLKTAYYRKFNTILGQVRPTETVIIDGLNPRLVTVMRFSGFAYRTVPASWMQRDFLPRFQEQ
jgi:hypothetical protein